MNTFENMYSLESEQNVIGSILIDCSLLERVSFLCPDDFYSRSHRIIFEMAVKLNKQGVPFDGLVICENLTGDQELDVGGFAYLVELSRNTPTTKLLVTHADIVKDFSIKRNCIDDLQKSIYEIAEKGSNALNVISKASSKVDKHVISISRADHLSVDELIDETIKQMEVSASGLRIGIKTGIDEIDDRLGYKHLAFGEITVIGALSKNGKTLVANTIVARAEFMENESCHIFSVEMPAVSMFNGIISAKTGIPSNFYARQNFYMNLPTFDYELSMKRWGAAAQELRDNGRITIDGQKQVDIDYIVSNIKKQFSLHRSRGQKLRMVVIDHWHRMDFSGEKTMTYAMRDSARKLKNIAAELDIAVVLLAQLNNLSQGKDPSSFDILDTSALRHELQCFIGTRMYRQDGATYFGIFADSQRYADISTIHDPAYMVLHGGVLRSLPEGQKFMPNKEDQK